MITTSSCWLSTEQDNPTMKILILNGPNLNRLGQRNPDIYGSETMEQVVLNIQRTMPDLCLEYRQSNHEGDLIDWIQEASSTDEMHTSLPYDGVVLNAGGLTHTSVSLRDAVEDAMAQNLRIVEVHISDIHTRETFRQHSLLTEVCAFSIIGHGTKGYLEAIQWLVK